MGRDLVERPRLAVLLAIVLIALLVTAGAIGAALAGRDDEEAPLARSSGEQVDRAQPEELRSLQSRIIGLQRLRARERRAVSERATRLRRRLDRVERADTASRRGTERLGRTNKTPPPVTARLNLKRTNRELRQDTARLERANKKLRGAVRRVQRRPR